MNTLNRQFYTPTISILSLIAEVYRDKKLSAFDRKHAINILRSVGMYRMSSKVNYHAGSVRVWTRKVEKRAFSELKKYAISAARETIQ